MLVISFLVTIIPRKNPNSTGLSHTNEKDIIRPPSYAVETNETELHHDLEKRINPSSKPLSQAESPLLDLYPKYNLKRKKAGDFFFRYFPPKLEKGPDF